MPRTLILIEFNEISSKLVQRFMLSGDLPTFRAFYEASTIYTTHAGDAPLEPWIQWPSIHSGVSYSQHGVRYLGDGSACPYPGVATLLSEAGIRVGIFGSINCNYGRLNGYYIPDPWANASLVHPRTLRPYHDFVAKSVQESSKEGGIPLSALRFVAFMLRHGLRLKTAKAIVSQLVREFRSPGTKWKRVAILDRLQYDAFRHLNRQLRVEFATFFSNSTAHLQHYYWRNMDPSGFRVPMSPSDDPSTRDAIRFGYQAMDQLLHDIIQDNPEALLVLCSGFSQQPWFETTKCTYRPRDFATFLQFAGITQVDLRPVMAECFRIEHRTNAEAQHTADALRRLTVSNEPIMAVDLRDRTVYSGCDLYDADDDIYEKTVTSVNGRRRFGDLFYRITTMNSGQHHPEGLLWVRNGTHLVVDRLIPLTAIAPMLLQHFGVPSPIIKDPSQQASTR